MSSRMAGAFGSAEHDRRSAGTGCGTSFILVITTGAGVTPEHAAQNIGNDARNRAAILRGGMSDRIFHL